MGIILCRVVSFGVHPSVPLDMGRGVPGQAWGEGLCRGPRGALHRRHERHGRRPRHWPPHHQGREWPPQHHLRRPRYWAAVVRGSMELKKRTFDLLPEAEANILQLQKLVDKASDRLVELATEWEKHRMPLIAELRKLTDSQHEAQGESRVRLEEIKQMRADMKKLVDEIKLKDDRYKQLVEILHDTRVLQKEINTITDMLGRSFAVAEDMIYQDCKKDTKQNAASALRKLAYKHIVAINEKYVKAIEDMGAVSNSILNLEAKIEQLQTRASGLNVEWLDADLRAIKVENDKLWVCIDAVDGGATDPAEAATAADTVVAADAAGVAAAEAAAAGAVVAGRCGD
eukprot:TRINITY_DN9072_c0_g1_i1.p1 TRINITY_DN9072_c0_g1~~TRINITY_DN9072_c0_g1_i1.p1  ORF type:complete len:343 (-),score=95.87 TRINITY_DN9072_c0_g1_i1:278-1306(-)